MIVNTSETAAESYAQEKASGKIQTLLQGFEEYLKDNGPSVAADITKFFKVDGRNHTRLRDLWKTGRVRKTKILARAKSTNKFGDVWEYVPEGIARMHARLEYWIDLKKRYEEEVSKKIPKRMANADKEITTLHNAIYGGGN